jgi:DNA replication protein DnaD
MGTINISDRIAATLYSLGTLFALDSIFTNNNNNNNNNNNKQHISVNSDTSLC